MAFTAFDLFGGVITHRGTMTGGFDALTVQDGGCGTTAFALAAPHQDAQGVMDHGSLIGGDPLAEKSDALFPNRESRPADSATDSPVAGGKPSPRASAGRLWVAFRDSSRA